MERLQGEYKYINILVTLTQVEIIDSWGQGKLGLTINERMKTV